MWRLTLVILILCVNSACAPASRHEPAATPAPTHPPSSPAADVTLTLGAPTGATLKPLLGVNIGPGPSGEAGNADLTRAYKQIGVNLIRTHDFYGPLDMSQMYPDRTRDPARPESYNLAPSDAAWKKIVDNGFEPYLRLGDSWDDVKPPANAPERANWVKAAVEIVRHYRAGKWNGFNTRFRCVEIWNEPDYEQFWPQPYTRLDFFQLYAETAAALKVAFPDLRAGGSGFSPGCALSTQGQQYTQAFLDHVQSNQAPLDFLSWHIWPRHGNWLGLSLGHVMVTWYVPMIDRLRTVLEPTGLLYIGDCKMSALATRALPT